MVPILGGPYRTRGRTGNATSACLALVPGSHAGAQIAGSTRVGITVEEMRAVAIGWSAKKQILRQPVYNEQKQKVGIVDDLIIAPTPRCRSSSSAQEASWGWVGMTWPFR